MSFKFFSLAQSFTPAGSPLSVVEVRTGCCDALDPGPVTLRVDIRDGGVAGPVIGSSAQVVLQHGEPTGLQPFAFDPPLPLGIGSLYVIQLVRVAGGNGFWGEGADTYAGGTAFANGVAKPGDRSFRTGVPGQVDLGASIPVEYSNLLDERAIAGGDDHGALDPGQVLFTLAPDLVGNSNPGDGPDFLPLLEAGSDATQQVDALASERDYLFDDVVANDADLLVSVLGDAGAAEIAVFSEDSLGATSDYLTHGELHAGEGAGDIEDVDGLELWGSVSAGDAALYSLASDSTSGVSVYRFAAGASAAFISHGQIVTAVQALGFVGDPASVDLDALMLKNLGLATAFDAGDQILFSIRAAGNFHGGEIMALSFGAAPAFLQHGGHAWNTGFDVSAALGSASDEVDGLEAALVSDVAAPVPALGVTPLALLALALLGVLALASHSPVRPR